MAHFQRYSLGLQKSMKQSDFIKQNLKKMEEKMIIDEDKIEFSKNQNEEVLNEFISFCKQHPELRFWQALYAFIGVVGENGITVNGEDPFYWNKKNGY